MKLESKGILLIFVLFIILFFANIFEAGGQPYTFENYGSGVKVIKNFTEIDGCYYAAIEMQGNSSFEIYNGNDKANLTLNDATYSLSHRTWNDYNDYITYNTNTFYLKIDGTTISTLSVNNLPSGFFSYTDFLNDGVLTIPAGLTISIPSNVSLSVSNIIFSNPPGNGSNIKYGNLIVNGELTIQSNNDVIIRGNITNNNKIYIKNTNVSFNNKNIGGYSVKLINNYDSKIILDNDGTQNKVLTILTSKGEQFQNNGEIEGLNYDVSYDVGSEQGSANIELGTTKLSNGDLHIKAQGGNGYEMDILAANTIYVDGDNPKITISDNAIFDEIIGGGSSMKVDVKPGANIFVKVVNSNNKFTIGENSSLSFCSNPVYEHADNFATMSDHSILNYVMGEYYIDNNGNKTYITPIDEGDVTAVTVATPKEMNWYEQIIAILTGQSLYDYTDAAVQLYAAYDAPEECQIAHTHDKNELILPIELVYFKINGNKFEWETASEKNNKYFVVEYSKNDDTTWYECTSQMSSLSNTGWVYECTIPDSTKLSKISNYRLKQVDFDGKYSYSDILSTSWKAQTPQYQEKGSSKAYITSDGKILYNYDQLSTGVYIEKSENGIRRIVKVK